MILPVLLAASGGLAGCATSNTTSTASLAPTIAASDPLLPETVAAIPSESPGSVEDGMRSLAHEVENSAQAQPAAYAAPSSGGTALAAVETASRTAPTETAVVPASVSAKPAGEPYDEPDGPSVVDTVVQAPVEVAKATADAIGAAAGALPGRFGYASPSPGDAPPQPPAGRLGPSGGVDARSPELDNLMRKYADYYGVPEELVRRVAKRESTFNPRARNGPYLGLMQISHATARGMGYRGAPNGLLDAETNLKYAVRYLRGAFVVAKGNHGVADRLYQTGYYYHAKRAGLLDETGVGVDRKVRRRSL